MVLDKTAKISDRSEGAEPRIYPKKAASAVFAVAGADKELPVGTVVAFNTSSNGYTEWANGGADDTGQIRGIVHPDPVTVLTSGEVAGTIMLEGEAHRADLVSDGGTATQLDAALAAQARERGIFVRGLADVR